MEIVAYWILPYVDWVSLLEFVYDFWYRKGKGGSLLLYWSLRIVLNVYRGTFLGDLSHPVFLSLWLISIAVSTACSGMSLVVTSKYIW